MAEEKVMIPVGSAGIMGLSPDIRLSGIEIDPKVLIIAVFAYVLVIKLAGFFIS